MDIFLEAWDISHEREDIESVTKRINHTQINVSWWCGATRIASMYMKGLEVGSGHW